MKLKIVVAIAALAAFAISSGSATAGNGDKVTGGGQILVGSNAGTTIAFTAQGTTSEAKGQLTIIDRGTFNESTGKGQAQEKFKGIVDCVETGQVDPQDANSAGFGVVSGFERRNPTNRFLLRVIDNGQGAAADSDMIDFEEGVTDDADTCKPFEEEEVEDSTDLRFDLGRGNAKVRDAAGDANDPEPAAEQAEETSASAPLSLLGL